MRNIDWGSVFFPVFVTLFFSCGAYCLITDTTPKSLLLNVIVRASDNMTYDETTYMHSEMNEKIGMKFDFYYDDKKDAYGVKVDKKYDYFANDIGMYYGQNDVFFVKSDKLELLYLVVGNKNNSYSVKDVVKMIGKKTIDIDSMYNGVRIKNFEYNDGLGWVANCEDGGTSYVKRVCDSTYEYKDYLVSDSYASVALEAVFNGSTGTYDITFDKSTINKKPLAKADGENGEKIYDIVYFDLSTISCGVVCRYNQKSSTWEMEKIVNIPVLDETKDLYESNEVVPLEKLGMSVNRIENENENIFQCFDSNGKFINSYTYSNNPSLTEK